MSTEFAWPDVTKPSRPAAGPPRAGLLSARSWGELLYAVVDLAPAIVFFVAIITLLSVGVGLAIIYVGVPIIALALLVARLGGLVQRSMALALLDLPSDSPGWAAPRRSGPISALGALLRDAGSWRAVAYFIIKMALAPVTFAVAVGFYAYGAGMVTFTLWRPFLSAELAPDGSMYRGELWWPNFLVDTWPGMVVLALLGLGVLWCAPRVVRFLTTIDRMLIVSLLAGTDSPTGSDGTRHPRLY
jgi:hypothetical protein